LDLGSAEGAIVQILIDHSGYELRNLGDASMLQVCVRRMQEAFPAARVDVITTAPERLEALCPGTLPVRSSLVDKPGVRALPQSGGLALEQAWKACGPYLVHSPGRPSRSSARDSSVLQAIRRADAVVAAGGGYLTDAWWWHAAGVLSVLRAAQRLGKPTAMFGQGLGPLTNTAIRRQASTVLPGLRVLGLRERVTGVPLAEELRMPSDRLAVTGDDALEMATMATPDPPLDQDVLGVNVRLADYTNLSFSEVGALRTVIAELATDRPIALQALPISRHADSDDLASTAQLLAGLSPRQLVLEEITTPAALIHATARCRAVITASYHAAVFALAAGVPAVCVSHSPYYDGKFRGLVDLFPEAAAFVQLQRPGALEELRWSLAQAWNAPAKVREGARLSAAHQVRNGRALYARFLDQLAPTVRPAVTHP
jgi:polysaccharide pyruvyl transferase WcaK-like protein